MKFSSFVISVFIAVVVAADTNLVNVSFLTECRCPNCRDYVNDELVPALTKAGLFDYVSLDVISWGNAYTETSLCPSKKPGVYDADVRKCWNSKCVSGSGPEVEKECWGKWPNGITCQHGDDECVGNRVEACAIGISRSKGLKTTLAGYKFYACFVGEHFGDLNSAPQCAEDAGISWNDIQQCYKGVAGDAFLLEAAKRTNDMGPHSGVPYVRVNGKLVESGLKAAICAEIKGEKPSSCPKMSI